MTIWHEEGDSTLLSLITYYGDIITNGNQTTTDPASPSVSAPKTSLAANARRNNEKALNILLSAIPDRHLLSFHDAVDARSLWKAIKARFGGNEASKKMQKNLLKQQFETFTIGSREELDSAYERFQHILSMLELHDATSMTMEEIDIRWARWLMITARIMEVYEEDGRTIDLKPKNGITFDKIKIVFEQDDWRLRFDCRKCALWDKMDLVILTGDKDDDTPVSLAIIGYKTQRTLTVPNVYGLVIFSSWDEALTDSAYEKFQKRKGPTKAVPPATDWVDSVDGRSDVSESQKKLFFNSENSEKSLITAPNSQQGNQKEYLKGTLLIIDSGCSGSVTGDEKQRLPRKNDVYSLDLKNIIPSGEITCLVAKAISDEAVLWHSRWGIKGKQHQGILQEDEERMSGEPRDIGYIWICLDMFQWRENQKGKGDKVSTLDDVEDLDDQQFIVHTAQPMHPEERTADKEIPLSSAEQALHDELGKECVDSTFTLSTANTPPQSTGNTPTDSDDDISKDGVFSTNSFDAEEGGVADYNNMDLH
ncbi:hypothetical protein Tco_0725694 [Tanacetum coccineum]|uniref:Uncharacterized protein n=1 Tax=Tanacetum coccineum TaxID=301880 RepID=A0ABQ4YFS9_9ASTR